jgi:hypothetical protein
MSGQVGLHLAHQLRELHTSVTELAHIQRSALLQWWAPRDLRRRWKLSPAALSALLVAQRVVTPDQIGRGKKPLVHIGDVLRLDAVVASTRGLRPGPVARVTADTTEGAQS